MQKGVKWYKTTLATIGGMLMFGAIVGVLSNPNGIVQIIIWVMLFFVGFLLIVIAIIRSLLARDISKIVSQLEILKEQFAEAARTYPQMMHILLQQSKDGTAPLYPFIITSPLEWQNDKRRRASNECGYPTKHAIIFTCSFAQTVLSEQERTTANYDMLNLFSRLASKAGETIAAIDDSDLPISKAELWVRDPKEYWLLLLHYFHPQQRDFWFVPESETVLKEEGLKMRPAKNGEPYSAILDDVFLASAMACGTLLERIKQ